MQTRKQAQRNERLSALRITIENIDAEIITLQNTKTVLKRRFEKLINEDMDTLSYLEKKRLFRT